MFDVERGGYPLPPPPPPPAPSAFELHLTASEVAGVKRAAVIAALLAVAVVSFHTGRDVVVEDMRRLPPIVTVGECAQVVDLRPMRTPSAVPPCR